jgi:Beta-galactosidase
LEFFMMPSMFRLSLLSRSALLLGLVSLSNVAHAKVVVFWQPGFPTVESEPLTREVLVKALDGADPVFADEDALQRPATLENVDLLVLPYGSAVPVDSWSAIERYVQRGGNLLIIGGQPLGVPVRRIGPTYQAERQQDTYGQTLGFRHTYEVPVPENSNFAWRTGYGLSPISFIRAKRFFAVEGHLDGLGYMSDESGLLVAAPVIVADHTFGATGESRVVALDFNPAPGYWESGDGTNLIRQAANYVRGGATHLSIELLFSTLRPGELPVISIHLHNARLQSAPGEIRLTLSSEGKALDTATLPVQPAAQVDLTAPFHKALPPGLYTVSATYSESGQFRAFHQNGFWVEDPKAVESGPVLGVKGDFITRNGGPFFPVGTNYFSTESNGWDFSGPRNASVWEQDFAEMEQHGVSFVRTGVWMPYGRFVEAGTGGGVNERFLRNLEAFLLCAQKHNIAVNFTFFAFAPRANESRPQESQAPPNPYLDPGALHSEQAYVRSVVERFRNVPWLSWDLINEPSFSNPRTIFHGNVPNGDPVEVEAWREWLKAKYSGSLAALGSAWSVPEAELASFDAIPLPASGDLNYERYGNPHEVRALDYNLFAQDRFGNWVKGMVALIRNTGSKQLIDVGQDEGGVSDRLLNQFFGGSGVSFTTNHTYWQDDALPWDSVAAKRPGIPNITGETGYQPVWAPDGTWRYDEFTGLGLTERKWALGFAAGSSGAMQWDWDREVDFGMKRSDGSAKVWENEMRDLGNFAQNAAPFATEMQLPDVAIVLPQSLQLSVYKAQAREAQQAAVRQIYGGAGAEAYAVGEYQIELLGSPKLIMLPSPLGLADAAWNTILDHVKNGATLLVTGPFDDDAHLHPTGRQDTIGLPYKQTPLEIRDQAAHFPWGEEHVQFTGNKTTVLTQARLTDGSAWGEKALGKGHILFCTLPLELSDSPETLADAYRYALKVAEVSPIYVRDKMSGGILIAPTVFQKATLYVITSESNERQVSFTDTRSRKHFEGTLDPGTAAILLVGTDGRVLSSYRWPADQAEQAGPSQLNRPQ